MSALVKIEETYLKLFKIVLLLILTLALLAAIVTVIKGLVDFTAKPEPVSPAQTAPEPKVDVDAFIKALEKRDEPTAPTPAAPAPQAPQAPRAHPMDELAAAHLAKAWSYYDAYQKACNVPNKIEQDGFMTSDFPRNSFRNWFRKFGPNFAESQDKFISTVLANPSVIKICIDKQGRGGVFSGALNWHMEEWVDAVEAAAKFNREEQNRVIRQERAAEERAMATRMEGVQMLWGALISFGVFMSLALLLIFSKIETNLRGVRLTASKE